MASIFVQIAAYRDSEVTPTILDAIKQSSGNHTINFGVHTVYVDESEINFPDLPNVKHASSKAPENIGLGITLWTGEFEGRNDSWLRWCDQNGDILLTGDELAKVAEERAKNAEEHAKNAEERAKNAEERAQLLAEKLKALGVDPDNM